MAVCPYNRHSMTIIFSINHKKGEWREYMQNFIAFLSNYTDSVALVLVFGDHCVYI